jgi:protease I
MAGKLEGKTVAILVANEGIEQVELTEPRKALEDAGATVHLIAPETGEAQAFNHLDKADTFPVDKTAGDARPEDYDALMLPGGVANPDNLRMHDDAVAFARAFFDAGKPVAAICHAPWTLVEADVVRGRRLTSWPSLQTDIRNAGGEWVDEEVVTDSVPPTLVTSRKPDDLPAFCAKMVEEFAEGAHEGQKPSERFEKPGLKMPG